MKKLLLLLLVLVHASLSAATINVTTESAYYSKYITPFGVTPYDDWNLQTQVKATVVLDRATVSFGVLNFSSFNGEWDSGDETDLILGGTFKLTDNWELRATYAHFLKVDDDTHRPSLGVYTKFKGWEFGVNVLNFHTEAPTGSRLVANLSATRSFDLTDKISVSSSSALVYDFANLVMDEGLLLRQQISLDYKLTKSLTLTPIGAILYVPLTIDDVRETDAVWYIGGKIKF